MWECASVCVQKSSYNNFYISFRGDAEEEEEEEEGGGGGGRCEDGPLSAPVSASVESNRSSGHQVIRSSGHREDACHREKQGQGESRRAHGAVCHSRKDEQGKEPC